MLQFILNDKIITTELPAGMVILDFIRYHLHLTGTKIGCREGDCGACTILVGEQVKIPEAVSLRYQSMTSCLMPIGNAHGKHIVTVEGLNFSNTLNPVQKAMVDEGATQCGFCTPGFVMSLVGFCLNEVAATKENAIAAIDGNICRCTGYKSIEKASGKVADMLKERNGEDPVLFLAKKKILPDYFTGIKNKLLGLQVSQKEAIAPGLHIENERPHLVGGGTDLYVQKHEEMTTAAIRFVFDHPELNGISIDGNKCIMGPSVTVSDLLHSPIINDAFPSFRHYAKLVSSTPIRNMATIAGNFINASPIGDFTIFFLALDARLELSDGNTTRELPLRKLYTGYKTLYKTPEEHIEKIWFELPGSNTHFHFEKVSKRTNLDIASVNSAIHLRVNGDIIEQAGIAAGGVGPVPLYLQKASSFLKRKKISEELVHELIAVIVTEISPISDARGTKEYKTLLLGQLIKAHFMKLFPSLLTDKIMILK